MNADSLISTAELLMANDKGLLAMDESNATCNRRFDSLEIAPTEENRRSYRELIVTAPGLNKYISGAILYDETIRQRTSDGTAFIRILLDAGIVPGVKVDVGTKAMPGHDGEKITEGLDGLADRLGEYRSMGARFAKWRAVIALGEGRPSRACIDANSHALALFAATCQAASLVPIVEPEVLMHGDHSMELCGAVTEEVLRAVFNQLNIQGVLLEGMILKPNMVLPGLGSVNQETSDAVAVATIKCLRRAAPAAVAGIAFLSGGQTPELAAARLCAINSHSEKASPWPLTFSFARGIQQPALAVWKGRTAHVATAQTALVHRAHCAQLARRGQYNATSELTNQFHTEQFQCK